MARRKEELELSLVDNFTRGLKSIDRGVNGLGASILKINAAGELAAKGINLIGGAASALTGVVTGAADLEEAIDRVASISNATAEEQSALYAAVQEASDRYNVSALQAAEALRLLAEDGFSAQGAITALGSALAFAQANGQGAATAVQALGSVLDQFGEPGEKIGALADAITATARESGTSATAIQEGLARVGVAAEQAGLSVETTTALLGLLAQKGIEGGRGAQALGTAIQDLANPASTAGRALEDLGISGDDFLGVLSRLQSDSTAAEEVLAALGNRPRAALQALLDQGGGALQQFIELIRNSAGASQEAAKDLAGGFNVQLDRLLNAVAGVRDELAQPLLEPLANEAGELATKLRELAASEGFGRLKDQIAEFASASAAAIGEFIETFDFNEAVSSTSAAVSAITADLKRLADAGITVADAVNGTVKVLEALKTVSDVVSLQPLVGRLIETNNAITALADDAPAAAGGIDDLAAAGQRSGNVFTGLQRRIDELRTAAGQRLQEALSATRQSIANVNDGVARSIPTLVQYETRIAAAAKAGDAAEVARLTAAYSKQKQELLQAAEGAGTLSERMVKLRASIAAALERGDTDKANGLAKRLAEIQREAQKADAELQKILAKNGVLTGQTGQIVDGNRKVADSNADVTESNAKVADSAKQVGEGAKQAADGLKVQVTAADAARSAAQAIAARIKALREEFSFSAGAAEAFELRLSALNRAMLGSGISTAIGQYQARLEGVGATIRRLVETQAQAADQIEGSLGLAGAYGDLDTVIAQLRGLEAETRNVNGRFNLLSEQRLDQLRAQIRATTGDLQQTARQLDDLIDRLQDERDRRNNDQESIAKREYERELGRIAELERTGGEAARRRAEEARRLARENHDAELREIRERAQADRDRDRERDERERARQDRGRNERTQTSSAADSGGGTASGAVSITINYTPTVGDLGSEEGVNRLARLMSTKLDQMRRRSL